MAGGMQGGDPEDMDRVAGVIDAEREQIEGTRDELQSRVDALIPNIWNGPDADAFVGNFNSDIRPQFDAVIEEMQQSAEELRRNADEQRTTSAQ